jgi:RHS repeat-associated protein
LERRNDAAGELSALAGSELSEVHFDDAQARLYDANNKRFLQADPIGGSLLNSQTLNPYSYCNNNPANLIDPTGMWDDTPDARGVRDSQRSSEDQAAIIAATNAYYTATTQAGRDAAHATAVYIREHPSDGKSNINIPTNSNYYGYSTYPPSSTTVLMRAIKATHPVLPVSEVEKTAKAWIARVEEIKRTVMYAMPPLPQVTVDKPDSSQPTETSATKSGTLSGALATADDSFQNGILRGSGSLNAGYGEVNARFQFDSKITGESSMLGVFGKASVCNATGEIGVGNDDVSASLKGVADVGTVTAQVGIQAKDGFGIAAKAKASAASGRATVEFDIFGVEFELGVTGELGSIGVGATIGYFPEEGYKFEPSVSVIFGGGIVVRIKPAA